MFKTKELYHAAGYFRLSREDGDKAESDSIRNQKALIAGYLKQHPDLKLVEEYVDDGFSGTNFDRPAFKRLMDDASEHKVDCIIVKDLSRLGRNYIETGRYLETIFPMMGIRFISVNDQYDSSDRSDQTDDIVIPFKNLLNDAYCRDISMKIRSQLDVKRKSGQFIGSFATYGYTRDPENKNHLVIDDYAADVVRRIFKLRLEGSSAQMICDDLNSSHVLTPMEYKRSKGFNYNCGFRSHMNPVWQPQLIHRILTNEIYIGVLVQGKRRKINYKVKTIQNVNEEEWYRMEDVHEPIISREDFILVQEIMKRDARRSPQMDEIYPLSGYVKCGSCGQSMVIRKARKNGKEYRYFHCSTAKRKEGCSSHLINAETVEKIVTSAIRSQVELLTDKISLLDRLGEIPVQNGRVKEIDRAIEKQDIEINRYKELKAKLFSDRCDKFVSDDEYGVINDRFTKKLNEACEERKRLAIEKEDLIDRKSGFRQWTEEVKRIDKIDSLTRTLVVMFLDKVIVYDRGDIGVMFRFGEELEAIALNGKVGSGYEEKGDDGHREVSICGA